MKAAFPLVNLVLGVSLGCACDDAPSAGSPVPRDVAVPEITSATPMPSGSQPAASPGNVDAVQGLPPVTLDGVNHPFAVSLVAAGRPRVYARAMRVWVRERPDASARRLGYLRAGASSPTEPEPVGRSGCAGGWYPVEPRGYVCVGTKATLDASDPVVRATREYPPDSTWKLPYVYGTVRNPGPIYTRLPSAEEVRKEEPGHDARMERWLRARGEIGASYAQEVWVGGTGSLISPEIAWREGRSDPVPWFLQAGRTLPRPALRTQPEALTLGTMKPRAGYAFLHTFLHGGRRYGVTTDMTLMPTDRLRPIRGSGFHGFVIGKDVEFPFAIIRRADARFFIHQRTTNRLIDAGAAPHRQPIPLTGKQQFFDGRLHYETKERQWVSDLHASRIEPAKRMPAWGTRGEKWIDVNLSKQTLMLYEGEEPVYVTLISSGEAGLEDPEHTTATKRGIFRIHTKHVTATMSSDEVGEEFELRDVPYVQYFDKEGYALHGAYWHDRFGTPKSHGCLNLSPEDARRVFYFTDPAVPVGWHGALLPLKGTVIFIHP